MQLGRGSLNIKSSLKAVKYSKCHHWRRDPNGFPKLCYTFNKLLVMKNFFFCNSSLVVSHIIINLSDYKGVSLLKNVGMCCWACIYMVYYYNVFLIRNWMRHKWKSFRQHWKVLHKRTKPSSLKPRSDYMTFTCMLHVTQVNSVVAKCQGSILMAIIYSEGSVSWPPISTMFLKHKLFFISFLLCSNVAKQVARSAVHFILPL